MTAVDTNIIVRLLTGDDAAQFAKARQIFADQEIFIAATVILETEWVLRFAYKFEPDAINTAFTKLFGLGNVKMAHPDTIATALDWHRQGLDFADALHLAACHEQSRFVTFDAHFVNKAKNISSCQVESP